MVLNTQQVIMESGIEFGTSGARGLVEQFTPDVCAAFTHAFISILEVNYKLSRVAIATDNRPSSAAMAQACISALIQRDIEYVYYGVIPTPALAYSSMNQGIACIMITGSHIPFDRNGLKFYTPVGEITKEHEQGILHADYAFTPVVDLPELVVNTYAAQQYIERYTSLFDSKLLRGKCIGIYEHSSAGRDLYSQIFSALGAKTVSIERSDSFVPIDTEAVSDEDKAKAKIWLKKYQLDFIFSTDGDGDRPLVAGEDGEWLRGDILGLLAASEMNIEALAIPVSCNSVINSSQGFSSVSLTKIGSPYVITEFTNLARRYQSIAGFEANGGFLLGSDIFINGRCLKALPTRDAVLPALMVLTAGLQQGIVPLVKDVSTRFTDSDRIQNFARERSLNILAKADGNESWLLKKLGYSDEVVSISKVDGLRMTLANGDIIHIRPSGNAPELRCYAESVTMERATSIVENVLEKISEIDF